MQKIDDLAPFIICEGKTTSVILNVGEYKSEVFLTREDEGFEGNGYDWASLAFVFLEEYAKDLKDKISFDPEASMFCAYSDDKEAVLDFIKRFRALCEDEKLITDLFSRAELD